MSHFQNVEEKFNLKNNIHDKKDGIGRANDAEEVEEIDLYENPNYYMNQMDTCLDNLATAFTQKKMFRQIIF